MKKLTLNLIKITFSLLLCLTLKPSFAESSDSIDYADFTAKQFCINTAEGPMRYRDEGKGAVIVMVHGIATSGWMYRSMINTYTQQGFRVIIPDMLGFGASDCPEGAIVYDPNHHAKRLLELLDKLGIKKCTFITQAEGSLWIAPILKNRPEMVEKTVFMNPLLNAAGLTSKNQLTIGILAKIGLLNMNWRAGSYVEKYLKSNSGDAKLSPSVTEGYLAGIKADKFAAILGHFEYISSSAFLTQFHYPSSENPQLILVGDAVKNLNWARQYDALNWPPSSSKETIETVTNGAELLTEQMPEYVTKKILDFIGGR